MPEKLIDNYFEHQLGRFNYQTDKLYMEKDASFRGYRQGSNTGGVEKITTTDEEQKLKYERQSQMEKNRSELIQSKHVPEKVLKKPESFHSVGHGI